MKQHLIRLILTVGVFGFSASVSADDHVDGEPEKSEHKFKHQHRSKSPAKMLRRVDDNQDGKVDLTEYLAHAEERFNKMDLNSDGYLTIEEGREAHTVMREKFKAERKQRREQRRAEREKLEQTNSN